MSNKKLLIVSTSAPSLIGANGGSQVYGLELAKHLLPLNVNVDYLGLNEIRNGIAYPEHEKIEKINIYRIGKSLKHLELIKWVVKHQKEYDVILENVQTYPLFLNIFLKTKTVALFHHFLGFSAFKVLSPIKALLSIIIEYGLLRFFYKNHIMVPSHFTKNFLLKNKITKNDKILVNHPGVVFYSSNLNKTSHPTILFVGTLNINRKKIDHLISAFKLVSQKFLKAELIIAGDGPARKLLEEQALNLNITFLGYVDEKTKNDLYAKSWIFVSPSYIEGFGITWVESCYHGTPVIVYDIGVETVNESCAILVEKGNIDKLAESMLNLLSDKELYKKLSSGSKKNALKYSWDSNAAKFNHLISDPYAF